MRGLKTRSFGSIEWAVMCGTGRTSGHYFRSGYHSDALDSAFVHWQGSLIIKSVVLSFASTTKGCGDTNVLTRSDATLPAGNCTCRDGPSDCFNLLLVIEEVVVVTPNLRDRPVSTPATYKTE